MKAWSLMVSFLVNEYLLPASHMCKSEKFGLLLGRRLYLLPREKVSS